MSAKASKTSTSSGKEAAKKLQTTPPTIQDASVQTAAGVLPNVVQRAAADPSAVRPTEILMLQRKYGNQAVRRLLSSHSVQSKLTVGPAGEQYEQEADGVADKVMAAPTPRRLQRQGGEEEELQTKPIAGQITRLQRQEDEEEIQTKPLAGQITQLQRQDDEEEIQTKHQDPRAGFEAGNVIEDHLQSQKGQGRPLPTEVRSYMEPRFGADFSGVRVHADHQAAQINRQLSAQAFTHGQDIYLGEGQTDLASRQGKQLLAHELTHTIQQTGRIQPRIQRWSVGGWFAKKGHESITADSVDQWNREAIRTGRPDLQISDKDQAQLIVGSRWNDLLGHKGVVTMGLALFGSKKSLAHQSHEGELQLLHGMASSAQESVWKTQHKIMTWAKFCYLIGTNQLGDVNTMKLGEVPMTPPNTEFEGGGVSIPELFDRWKGKTIAWLFSDSDKTDASKIRMRAIGSMMHMLQDTFCVSHVQRVASKGNEEDFRRIRAFNVYTEQSAGVLGGLFSKWKNRHGMADKLREKQVTKTAGATEAADVGMMVLKYVQQGAAWDAVVEPYLKKVFALEAERQPKVEEEARPEAPKVSASGRLFRKTWLSDEFKSASSVWFRTRPSDFKALDKQLASYVHLLKEDLNNMTRHQLPAQKEAQLKIEQALLQTIVEIIDLIKKKHARTEDKTMAKRLPALDNLLDKVNEDLNEVNSDLASVAQAQPEDQD